MIPGAEDSLFYEVDRLRSQLEEAKDLVREAVASGMWTYQPDWHKRARFLLNPRPDGQDKLMGGEG